jgi:exonuclease SbcC
MRPLSLSIKGFGPYLNLKLTEQDFKTLTEHKLFLISGEIGAGKTTLFDAIVYALYGEGTVEGRQPSDLISHFIKNRPGVIPEVDFKFFLDGKIYRIIRRPSFNGRSENVSLWIEGKIFSSKKTEVKNKIKELIGLDAKQFKKVFLIPQGEYRKILLAKKDERQALLETIFETFIFSQLEDFFKNRLKELKEKYQGLLKREEDLQKIAGVSTYKELKDKIFQIEKKIKISEEKEKELVSEKRNLEEEIKKIENLVQLYQKFNELSEQLEKIKNKEPGIKEKKELLNRLKILKENVSFYENSRRLWRNLRDQHLKRKKLKKELLKICEFLNFKKKEFEETLKLEPQIQNKRLVLERLKEIEKYIAQKKGLEKEMEKVSSLLQKNLRELEKSEKEFIQVKEKLEKFIEEKVQIGKVLLLIKEEKDLKKLLDKFREYEELLKKKNEVEGKLKEVEERHKELENLKKELEIQHHAEYLVQYLEEGKPCPVCGSLHHPNPAKAKNFEKEFTLLEKEFLKVKKNLEETQKEYYLVKARIEGIEKDLQSYKKDKLFLQYSKIEKDLFQYSSIVKKLKAEKDLENRLEKKVEKLKNSVNLLEKEIENRRKKVEDLKSRKRELAGQLKVIEEVLTGELLTGEEDISSRIKSLEEEVFSWESKKLALEKEVQELQSKKIQLETELKNLQYFLKETLSTYKENFFKVNQLKKSGVIENLKDLKKLIPLLSQIEEIEKAIQEFYQEKQRIEKNLEEIEKILKENEDEKYFGKYTALFDQLEVLNRKKLEIEENLSQLNQEIGSFRKELNQLEEIFTALKNIQEEKKSVEEEYPLVEFLYNLIIGKNKKGISFHSFVLSIFAKLIFKRANFYFKEFSFGRYKFIEDEILQKKFTLEIFDHYTGSKREAKTLSGGESFLATLSLALGTSDVILYLFRTKPFESLFIDEGFGSLDEVTLEKVVNVLLTLAHKSGRIIGIISHLKELKDKFPVVLEVCKDQISGSYVKINKKL